VHEGPDGGALWHIGTCIVDLGEAWVLHMSERAGSSVLQRLAECAMYGLFTEGFYRWL